MVWQSVSTEKSMATKGGVFVRIIFYLLIDLTGGRDRGVVSLGCRDQICKISEDFGIR